MRGKALHTARCPKATATVHDDDLLASHPYVVWCAYDGRTMRAYRTTLVDAIRTADNMIVGIEFVTSTPGGR